MEKDWIIDIVNEITSNTFKKIEKVYKYRQEGKQLFSDIDIETRLIFPHYRNGEIRISEQELRFMFVEEFNRYCDEQKIKNLYYSIETPTEHKYSFGDEENPCMDDDKKGARSAMIDLSIHKEDLERIALIEFKAMNPKDFCFRKDFLKLVEESKGKEEVCTFFILMIESADKETLRSLKDKVFNTNKGNDTFFKCCCLKKMDGEFDITEKIEKYQSES